MPERRLVVVRHAEAGSAGTDRDRPLTPRGRQQAAAVGTWLAGADLLPDGVLVSPAVRTAQTWDGLRTALDRAPEPIVDERLYDNTVDAVLGAVRETSDDATTLLVVGHAPSVAWFARVLDDGRGDAEVLRRLGAGYPPATVAVLAVPSAFGELDEGGATLLDVATPGG